MTVEDKPMKQMRIFIPADVHRKLKISAVYAEQNLADHVVSILRNKLIGEEKKSEDDSE